MNPPSKATQLVNFCQEPFTKRVECTSICADDHQVENLISQHVLQRQRGFRVERFIRPPVHLYLHFLAPINIACVAVKPDLTEGAEVNFTMFSTHSASQQQMMMCGRSSLKGEGAVLVMKNRVFDRTHQCKVELSLFPSVLASHVNQTDTVNASEEPLKDVFNVRCLKISINYFSGPRPVSLKWMEVWGILGASINRADTVMAHSAISSLMRTKWDGGDRTWSVAHFVPTPERGAREVLLCQPHKDKPLGRSSNDGELEERVSWVPATTSTYVRSLEEKEHSGLIEEKQLSVHSLTQSHCCNGTAHVSTTGSCGEKLENVFNSCDSTLSYQSCLVLSSGGGTLKQTPDRERKAKEVTAIPDRFLDEITFELMALPMLLPSGHYVDRSTLDKLHHTDSVYGRPPSDPFTGVAFSEHAQPQFSVELKQQIDSFLSRHEPTQLCSNEVGGSSFGRTLGSATEIAKHLSSAHKQVKRKVIEEVDNSPDRVCVPLSKKQKQSAITVAAAGGGGGKGPSKGWTSKSVAGACSPSLCNQLSTSGTSRPTKGGQGRGCLQAHELEVASSLDKELQDLLHS